MSSLRMMRKNLQRSVTLARQQRLWKEDEAQNIAEYAVMLAVILVIVVETIRLIGSNSSNIFSSSMR